MERKKGDVLAKKFIKAGVALKRMGCSKRRRKAMHGLEG